MLVRFDLLGQFRVSVDGREVSASEWRREKSAALVKLLALSTGHRIHREQAMDMLWPDKSLEAASTNLRKALHFARRALGEHDLIILKNDIILLAPGHEIKIDAEVFETAAKEALHGSDIAARAMVAEQYGGVLLPDDVYIEWAEERREQLRQLYTRLLRAACLWEKLLVVDPTDEEAQCAMMQAALKAGNRGEVIRQFQRLRERLRTDLGVGPAAATIAIYEQALSLSADKVDSSSIVDRVHGLLAWGIVSMQSGVCRKPSNLPEKLACWQLKPDFLVKWGKPAPFLGSLRTSEAVGWKCFGQNL